VLGHPHDLPGTKTFEHSKVPAMRPYVSATPVCMLSKNSILGGQNVANESQQKCTHSNLQKRGMHTFVQVSPQNKSATIPIFHELLKGTANKTCGYQPAAVENCTFFPSM